jgi:hypothetical protein
VKRSAGASISPPSPDDLRVTAADIAGIDVLQSILAVLNDPRASAGSLANQIRRSRVLSARIADHFHRRNVRHPPQELAQQIAIIGNRELEALLLQVLEDVITLHSEMAETTP